MHDVFLPIGSFQAAIFDMDGTMINNMGYHRKAWQKFLERHDIKLSEAEFKEKISGKKNDQIFELVFGSKLDAGAEKIYTEEKEAIYRELYAPDIKGIKGLSRIIAVLAAHDIKLAIATTAPAKNREFALESLGLEDKFEVILGDEHVTRGKPDPEIYVSTARELGVEPNRCLVFEDSPPGVASGKAAGMTVVGILSSHASSELPDADYLVEDFTHIKLV